MRKRWAGGSSSAARFWLRISISRWRWRNCSLGPPVRVGCRPSWASAGEAEKADTTDKETRRPLTTQRVVKGGQGNKARRHEGTWAQREESNGVSFVPP